MPKLDAAIDIKAPSEKVFAVISNVEAQPQWCKWAKEVDVTSPNIKGPGATDEMLMQIGPRKERVEGLVIEYKEGENFGRRLTRGLHMSETYAVVPAEDGMTKVEWTIEYTPPMGAIGKVMGFIFMERLFEQLQGDSLTNLKELLETTK